MTVKLESLMNRLQAQEKIVNSLPFPVFHSIRDRTSRDPLGEHPGSLIGVFQLGRLDNEGNFQLIHLIQELSWAIAFVTIRS